jgi:hypothetical protein
MKNLRGPAQFTFRNAPGRFVTNTDDRVSDDDRGI